MHTSNHKGADVSSSTSHQELNKTLTCNDGGTGHDTAHVEVHISADEQGSETHLHSFIRESEHGPDDGPVAQGIFQYQGKRYESVQPSPWRLLEFMWDKREADVETAYRYAVDDERRDPTDRAVNSMIRKANIAIEATVYPLRLSKPKGVRKIVWA